MVSWFSWEWREAFLAMMSMPKRKQQYVVDVGRILNRKLPIIVELGRSYSSMLDQYICFLWLWVTLRERQRGVGKVYKCSSAWGVISRLKQVSERVCQTTPKEGTYIARPILETWKEYLEVTEENLSSTANKEELYGAIAQKTVRCDLTNF